MTEIGQAIAIAVSVLVIAPLLILMFIGLTALIIGLTKQSIRDYYRAGKSVEALINGVKGIGRPQPDSLETRVRQLMREGQQQVEKEAMANLDNIVTFIRDEETNHR